MFWPCRHAEQLTMTADAGQCTRVLKQPHDCSTRLLSTCLVKTRISVVFWEAFIPGADKLAALAELPREVRQALVSWNHATDYELPSYSTYAGGKGTGLFEKTYDLGASAHPAVHPAFWPSVRCQVA